MTDKPDLAAMLEDALDAVGVQLGVKSRYATAAARLHERGVRVGDPNEVSNLASSANERARLAEAVRGIEIKDDTGDNWDRPVVCGHPDGPCGFRAAVLALLEGGRCPD